MGRADEIIIEVLKRGPRTAKELIDECVRARKLPYSTYKRRLGNLIKLREVEEAKYKLIKKEKEADPEIIRDNIQIIRSDKPDEIRVAEAHHIERLCH